MESRPDQIQGSFGNYSDDDNFIWSMFLSEQIGIFSRAFERKGVLSNLEQLSHLLGDESRFSPKKFFELLDETIPSFFEYQVVQELDHDGGEEERALLNKELLELVSRYVLVAQDGYLHEGKEYCLGFEAKINLIAVINQLQDLVVGLINLSAESSLGHTANDEQFVMVDQVFLTNFVIEYFNILRKTSDFESVCIQISSPPDWEKLFFLAKEIFLQLKQEILLCTQDNDCKETFTLINDLLSLANRYIGTLLWSLSLEECQGISTDSVTEALEFIYNLIELIVTFVAEVLKTKPSLIEQFQRHVVDFDVLNELVQKH